MKRLKIDFGGSAMKKRCSVYAEKVALEKAIKDKQELAEEYGVPVSSIVWIGDNHYIVVKDGKEIKI